MEKIEPKITIMIDIDDCIWNLVEHWIDDYKDFIHYYDYMLYESHDKYLDISQVTSWDIVKCLKPTDPDLFWATLDNKDFWATMGVDKGVKQALEAINSHKNIDLIICTDTYYKSATPKLKRFFSLFPFIKPSQVICMKEKWRLDADIVIDDKPETLEKFMLKQNPPVAIVKINKPWNENTVCDYCFDKFNKDIARFCIEAAESYIDVMNEIRREEAEKYYERCYYN